MAVSMSSLTEGARILGRAVLDLDRAIDADPGPDPAKLRAIAGRLYDAAAALLEAAADVECGLVD